MSSENLSITNTDGYQIIMSPLLSNRFDKLESKIETLITKSEQIDSKYTTILQMLSENKQIYLSLLRENRELSQKNNTMLNNNRKVYSEALEQIKNTDENEIKPILKKLIKSNNDLTTNLLKPDYSQSRAINRFWRTSGINTITSKVFNSEEYQ
jgi:dsDNA-specific endonuclease/ATPase MutS2